MRQNLFDRLLLVAGQKGLNNQFFPTEKLSKRFIPIVCLTENMHLIEKLLVFLHCKKKVQNNQSPKGLISVLNRFMYPFKVYETKGFAIRCIFINP